MAHLRDRFEHFYAPGEDDIATAMQTGLATPDTNVLLALYRFQAGARDELFGALEKLGDRLWIPHQVGLEFHRNRINVISDQQQFFKETRQDLEQSITALKRSSLLLVPGSR
jgi:PIN like domain